VRNRGSDDRLVLKIIPLLVIATALLFLILHARETHKEKNGPSLDTGTQLTPQAPQAATGIPAAAVPSAGSPLSTAVQAPPAVEKGTAAAPGKSGPVTQDSASPGPTSKALATGKVRKRRHKGPEKEKGIDSLSHLPLPPAAEPR
jgi:hypothetical protein